MPFKSVVDNGTENIGRKVVLVVVGVPETGGPTYSYIVEKRRSRNGGEITIRTEMADLPTTGELGVLRHYIEEIEKYLRASYEV